MSSSTAHQSLEAERQSILDRMQMRRESYRRMLINGGTSIDQVADEPIPQHAALPQAAQQRHVAPVQYRTVPTQFPRSMIMRTVTEHPYLCALGVAAVVLIGPRRIVTSLVHASTTATALAAGNQSNMDMIGKFLAMAGAYVQGRSNDNR